jgi:hypothetical protein
MIVLASPTHPATVLHNEMGSDFRRTLCGSSPPSSRLYSSAWYLRRPEFPLSPFTENQGKHQEQKVRKTNKKICGKKRREEKNIKIFVMLRSVKYSVKFFQVYYAFLLHNKTDTGSLYVLQFTCFIKVF